MPEYAQNFDVSVTKPEMYYNSQIPRSGMATASTSGKSTPVTSTLRANDNMMPMKNYPAVDNRSRHDQYPSQQRFALVRDTRVDAVDSLRLGPGNDYGQSPMISNFSDRNDNFMLSKSKEAEIDLFRNQFSEMSIQQPYSALEREGVFGGPSKSSDLTPQRRVDYLSETLSASRSRPVVPPLNAITSPRKQDRELGNDMLGDYYGSSSYSLNSPSKGLNSFQSAGISSVNGSNILPSLQLSPAARNSLGSNKRFVSYSIQQLFFRKLFYCFIIRTWIEVCLVSIATKRKSRSLCTRF